MADPEHKSLSIADLKDIQAGPVVHVPTRYTIFLFFAIKDVPEFRKRFHAHVLSHITTSDKARGMQEEVSQAKSNSKMATVTGVKVCFSHRGLEKLLEENDTKDAAFEAGQWNRAESLGDDKAKWLPKFKAHTIDGLLEVSGYPDHHVRKFAHEKIRNPLGDSISIIYEHTGEVRPGKERGHEHFGFLDGISHPYVKFEDDNGKKREPWPGQTVVNPGVLVLGQPGDGVTPSHPAWTKNGSFLVYRHLKQRVPEFNAFLEDTVSKSIIIGPSIPSYNHKDSEEFKNRVEFLGARLMGRWRSGMPVVLTPWSDKEFPVDNPTLGTDPKRNNNFDYGARTENPREQFLCPFAAHTRKTAPRTDLPQAADEQHAIRRGGIAFGPEVTHEEHHLRKTICERGLSFVCYQSSVEAGFEFLQMKWSNNEKFPPKTPATVIPGVDPIISQTPGKPREMTGYDAADLGKELTLPPAQFVVPQGGEYFFLPSITLLKQISDPTVYY